MSTEEKPAAAPATPEGAIAIPMKTSPIGGVLRILIPGLLAAGAAYGGTRLAAAKATTVVIEHQIPSAGHHDESKPPGPTLPLDPFLVTLFDANKKPHPMKMSLAVEFDAKTHEDIKTFTPRLRDVIIAHLRLLTHEQAIDPQHVEKLRTELLEKCKAAGAHSAERILVTDFVVQ